MRARLRTVRTGTPVRRLAESPSANVRNRDADREHPYRLTEKGIRAGVWIDTGQWMFSGTMSKQVTEEPACIVRRTDTYTPGQAREQGWIE